jgi:putative ABC transport system ATP-binding protein
MDQLEARELRRKAGDLWLMRDVSLVLREGERLAVTGESGAGKTVLLRSLVMLDPLDGGQVRWRGEPVAAHDVPAFRAQCIYLQPKAVFPPGSVRDVLQSPYKLKMHCHRSFDEDRAVQRLRILGRDGAFLNKPTGELSGGESQLVALLRALELDPMVLLLDEPTSAMDGRTVASAEELIAAWLQEDGRRALAIVGHDAAQIARMSDRKILLEAGRMREVA